MTRDELLNLPPTIDLPTLGQILGLSHVTVRDLHKKGALPGGIQVFTLGRKIRVSTASVIAFLGDGLQPAVVDAADESRPVAASER